MCGGTGRKANGRRVTKPAHSTSPNEAVDSAGWVIPSEIPFSKLKSKDLEECVYWLLDAMGAKNLEWRVGGSGDGAADGGRDLEARFFLPSADADESEQRWWVECKGRDDKTLGKGAVIEAVNNALAYDITHLLIVANTQFSNPTRDWVKAWQAKHPSPIVLLWDGAELERRLSRHPDVVMRLFGSALSLEGKVKALDERFWNRLEYMPPRWLADIWTQRHELAFDLTSLVALTVNEFANGDITKRPWGAALDAEGRLTLLHLLVMNVGAFALRSDRAGAEQEPIIRGVAYSILCALEICSATAIADLLETSIARGGDVEVPDTVWDLLLGPVCDQLQSELQDVCASDCTRIIWSPHDHFTDDGDSIAGYWRRLHPSDADDNDDPRRNLRLETLSASCNVGFDLNEKRCCPLFEMDITRENIAAFLEVAKQVIAVRNAQHVEAEKANT